MCGIFGASGKIDKPTWLALAMYNTSRGQHSAGIAYHNGVLHCEKIAQHPYIAFNGALAKGIDKGINHGLLYGHTRWATMGEINNNNAHPWFSKDYSVVYAHNGHISNHGQFGNFKVDSQSLEAGILSRDFSQYQGKIGLCWIDENKNLFLYQHDQELAMAIKKGTVYFSSDEDHLKAVKLVPQKLKEGYVYRINNGKVIGKNKAPSPSKSVDFKPKFWYREKTEDFLNSFERVDNFENERG